MWLYLTLFGAMVVEGIGIPFFPGEAVLYLAVNQTAKTADALVLLLTIATTGNLVGACGLYYITCRVGARAALRISKRMGLTEADWSRFDRYMDRFGPYAVIFARFSGPLRPVATLAAGLARMEPWRFVVFYTCGALIYNTLIILFMRQLRERPWLLLVLLPIGLINGLLVLRRRRWSVPW